MEEIIILYVDDEPDLLKSMKSGLEDRGYHVLAASSGEEALSLLKENRPHIIITDLRMIPMNGFEFFQAVKKIGRFFTTPFFFLTAVDDYLAEKYAQILGVDAYITKPVDINHLDLMIKKRLAAT
jgi:response regulator RpfG family c-di-GMP phosphodiesterase